MAEREPLWGIKIWGDDGLFFYTEIDISQSLTHYIPTESTDPYNSRFPWVIHNGIAGYYKGSVSGNFSDNQSSECYTDYNFGEHTVGGITYHNVKYIDRFITWLHNRKTKWLQLSEQLVIPIAVLDTIQWENEKSIDDGYNCKITFDWVQVADTFSLNDKDIINACPSCGGIVSPTAFFCQRCGERLRSE